MVSVMASGLTNVASVIPIPVHFYTVKWMLERHPALHVSHIQHLVLQQNPGQYDILISTYTGWLRNWPDGQFLSQPV